ncbi:hypothetical protein GCM10007301_53380 [Azorhizobium oxalatiphilum]|uniref:Uncharacterized protein n=1 Tax=Azorhizobium oxalatiphilum TaxID=980631 RepID=A0A917CH84_9HYPH|nr:hypothetical protein GCM10007301_53380 [Azorhizobium oxalatiphilum]
MHDGAVGNVSSVAVNYGLRKPNPRAGVEDFFAAWRAAAVRETDPLIQGRVTRGPFFAPVERQR